ncbi:MAG TPA: DUF3050 domain-containing protein [Polyangiales bacterium]|nr:DUF3050 domain-containing protein [Polyangiales bacterium]
MSGFEETSTTYFQARLARAIEPLHRALMDHPVYRRLSLEASNESGGTHQSGEYRFGTALAAAERGLRADSYPPISDNLLPLRCFMESHVFAVWDFMSLVKTLQQRLTCVRTPWHPPADALSARLINEIVLVEETDELGDGQYASHFDLYLTAMEEVGANTRPIRTFLSALRGGSSIAAALARTDIQHATKAFVMNTMSTINRDTHEVAASFVLGRESVIPLMFEQVLSTTSAIDAPSFRFYLQRHIEVDGEDHGPAGWRLLERLCGGDANRWIEAEASAKRALYSRRALWDGVCEVLDVPVDDAATG